MVEENEDLKIKSGNKYMFNASSNHATFEVSQVTGKIAFGKTSHDGYHNWGDAWYHLEDLKNCIMCEWTEEAQAEIDAMRVERATEESKPTKRKWSE